MNTVIKELNRIRSHCAKNGWNGYGAHRVSTSSWNNAKRLVETVLAGVPPPHVGVDNLTGRVSFQWGDLRRRSLTLYIGSDASDPIKCLQGVAGVFSQKLIRACDSELLREVEACK